MTCQRWLQSGFAKFYGVDAVTILDGAYSEPARAYHGWRHIDEMLDLLEAHREKAARPDLIAQAIYWHDVVYLTREADGSPRADARNVADSVDMFAAQALFLAPYEKEAVGAMIWATSGHGAPALRREPYVGFARDCALFLDFDLAAFAAEPGAFDRVTRRVREEFAWVGEQAFCDGRATVLERFAGAEPLYKTPELEAQWGDKARANLRRSVRELRAAAAQAA